MSDKIVLPILFGILILTGLGFSQQASATWFDHTHTENHTHYYNHVHSYIHEHKECHSHTLSPFCHYHYSDHTHYYNHEHSENHVHESIHSHLIEITQPDITVPAIGSWGNYVTFSPFVTMTEPPGYLECSPYSGSVFPIGSTTVTCTQSDNSGFSETMTFTVTVTSDDSDFDGVPNSIDQCPGDDDTIDVDNDGIPDCIDSIIDTDGDGTEDSTDECPFDPNKVLPGLEGCGLPELVTCAPGTTLNTATNQCEADPIPQVECAPGTTLNTATNQCEADQQPSQCAPGTTLNTATNQCELIPLDDSDGDGVPDDFDVCLDDPNKISPGFAGCGVDETADTDNDGTVDYFDQCPLDPNKIIFGFTGCGNPEPEPISCASGTTLNPATNQCEADVTQSQLDNAEDEIQNLFNILLNGEADICHNDKTKTVSIASIGTHLSHGDEFGACEE